MSTEASVTAVDPDEFDWSADAGPAAAVRRVQRASEESDHRSPLNEAVLLSLRHHGLADARLFLARDAEGSAQGFALAHGAEASGEPIDLNVVVAPAQRGQGVGGRLVDAVRAALPRATLSAWSHGNHPAAAALASSHGFARVRDLWVMRRPLDVALPALRPVDDLVVRSFRAGVDEQAFLEVNAEAFAHHPEQGGMTLDDLDERMREEWFDPAGFFLAFSGERLVGFHWTKVHDASVGEVYVVGVSPAAQGSGLGRLLTLTGLRHLASLGLEEVILYVESDNAPAVAVYAGLGFTHADADTDVMYLSTS